MAINVKRILENTGQGRQDGANSLKTGSITIDFSGGPVLLSGLFLTMGNRSWDA
jgi:hypothetical protein